MATFQKRKNKHSTSYKVMIRPKDGLPPVYKTFPTLQEAKDWAVQEEALRRQGLYFPELIDRYIELILPSIIKSSRDILRHLNWWREKIGGYALNCISPDVIAKYRKELVGGLTPKGTKRNPATVNRYMATLSAVFSYGVKECGWVTENPIIRVAKLKESKGRDRILSKEECDKLLIACSESKNPYLLTIVTLAICTGMRRSEITRLTWDNLDLEQGMIHLKDTKNGRPRSIPLIGTALTFLIDLVQKRNPHIPFIFPSKKRFGEISIRKAWDEAIKRASIQNLRFHDLRHTFATYAAKGGASNLELATAMGHQSLQMLQRYTHMDVAHTKKLSQYVSNQLL